MDTTIQPDMPLPHEGLPFQAPDVASEVTPEVPIIESNPQLESPGNQPQNEELSTTDAQLAMENVDTDCDYCQHKEKYQTLTDNYIEKVEAKTGDKVAIPFVEELALLLHKDEDILKLWLLDETHAQFIASIKKLLLIQKLRLLQRVMGRFNPDGAIFLLKTVHKI